MKKILLPMSMAGVLMASGCATILNDDTQSVNVRTSNNKQITVSVDGQQVETPASISVKRNKDDLQLLTAVENCAKVTKVPSTVDSVFFVNIFAGWLFGGSTTDYGTGKMWEYDADIVVNCNS